MGTAEIAGDFFLGVAALVMADDHGLVAGDAAHARDDGFVIAKTPVAMEFVKILHDHFDVIACLRAVGVAGDLHGLPRRQILIGFLEQGGQGLAQAVDLVGIVGVFGFLQIDQVGDLAASIATWAFQIPAATVATRGAGRWGRRVGG